MIEILHHLRIFIYLFLYCNTDVVKWCLQYYSIVIIRSLSLEYHIKHFLYFL